jgi:hypothetical protein
MHGRRALDALGFERAMVDPRLDAALLEALVDEPSIPSLYAKPCT